MNSDQLRQIVDSLPLTQKEIAEDICVTHSHLRNCLNGQVYLGRAAERLLEQLVKATS